MNVLVTGASGFLGGHIVDRSIAKKDTVRVLVRKTSDCGRLRKYKNIEYAYGDLTDREAVMKAVRGTDIVYHSAARATDWGTREQFLQANFIGTRNILDACVAGGVKRLVYVSSPGVVFDYTSLEKIDESCPYPEKFANYYAEYKAMAERLVLAANGTGRLTTVALRPHAIWGPGDVSGFFPRILRKVKEKKIRDFSCGKTVLLDMCHVTNAAAACILAGRSKRAAGKAYFITDGQTVDAWRFIDRVSDLFNVPRINKKINPRVASAAAAVFELVWKIPGLAENYPPPITRYAIALMSHSTTYSIEAAKKDLGYRPLMTVDRGLALLKQWVDDNGGIDAFVRNAR
jgi:nucleoside-diphosphate-sugar epimerase